MNGTKDTKQGAGEGEQVAAENKPNYKRLVKVLARLLTKRQEKEQQGKEAA